ncbi:MAG TPA: EAL domain-containing protein [Marinobacter sp.]|nr:EAL domain-containing protein [Marinobacter sp.]
MARKQETADSKPRSELSLGSLLILFASSLLVMMLAAAFIISFGHFRDYVAHQMTAHALDGATATGLSLSNAIDGSDPVASASLIDAVFDSGRYLAVEYLSHDGTVIAGRRMELADSVAPRWFIRLAELPRAQAEAEVVRGWTRLGKVRVTSHPGRAYRDLWRLSVGLLMSVLVVGGVGLVALFLLVRWLLQPLGALERQAQAWGRRDFRHRVQTRSTRELNRVTGAMNQMADDLEQMFRSQGRLIQFLRKVNSEDPVTGLATRSAFDQRLRAEVALEEKAAPGMLALICLGGFGDYNMAYGRAEGDELLRQVARRIEAFVAHHPQSFAGRRTGAEFVVFIPGVYAHDARVWFDGLVRDLDGVYGGLASPMDTNVYAGLAAATPGAGVRDLLAAADAALRTAQQSSKSNCCLEQAGADSHNNMEAWRRILMDVVESGSLSIWLQPMVSCDDQRLLHHQVFSRIPAIGGDLQAGTYLPMAERLGLVTELDRLLLGRVLTMLAKAPDQPLAISLGVASVGDERFCQELLERLGDAGKLASRLWIGVPELALKHHRKQAGRLVQSLARMGVPVMVDRFGVGGVSFSYLRNLPFRGIRIDHSFVHGVDGHAENRFWLEVVIGIAHSRGVRVFATAVETETEYSVLCKLGIDGAMGYHLGRPFGTDE